MDEQTGDTVKIRILPTAKYTFGDGTILEQLGEDSFRLTDMTGNHNGYLIAEEIVFKPTLEQEYQAMRVRDGADVLIRLMDRGIDRTPRAL